MCAMVKAASLSQGCPHLQLYRRKKKVCSPSGPELEDKRCLPLILWGEEGPGRMSATALADSGELCSQAEMSLDPRVITCK